MQFSCAGHERDWTLHRRATDAKLPYFWADGCHSYIGYAFFFTWKALIHNWHNSFNMVDLCAIVYPWHIVQLKVDSYVHRYKLNIRMAHGPAGAVGVAKDYSHMLIWPVCYILLTRWNVSQHYVWWHRRIDLAYFIYVRPPGPVRLQPAVLWPCHYLWKMNTHGYFINSWNSYIIMILKKILLSKLPRP